MEAGYSHGGGTAGTTAKSYLTGFVLALVLTLPHASAAASAPPVLRCRTRSS